MLTAEQRAACVQGVLRQARHVIETFGPRPPGSPGERAAAEYVARELSETADGPAEIERFQVAPKAFMGMQRVVGCLLLAAMILYWIAPKLALAASLAGVAVLYFELLRCRQFIDPFCRKTESCNVIARHAPKGPVKRRIVLNGHIDAAYEWRFHYAWPRWFPLVVLYTLVGLFFKAGLDLSFVILAGDWSGGYGSVWGVLGLGQLLFLPSILAGIFFTDFRHVAPGANDNLTGVFLTTGVARALHESGQRLENTEIVYLITGSEEAGLRGAKAYAEAHGERLRGMETLVVVLDTLRDLEHFAVYNRDLNGTVGHDPRACALMREAGTRSGRELPYGTVFLGSSDATAFTQAGIPAVALCAMDPAPADYYHNRRDTWEIMNPECLEAALAVVLEGMRAFDAEGLPPASA